MSQVSNHPNHGLQDQGKKSQIIFDRWGEPLSKVLVETEDERMAANKQYHGINTPIAGDPQNRDGMNPDIDCPYEDLPDSEMKTRFMTVWNALATDKERQHMKNNIAISDDGKLNIISLEKNFSPLTAEHNGVDIFSGDYVDKSNKKGVSGVTYFTGEAAERIAAEQGKKLFNTKEEAQAFMSCFPGENEEARVRNFAALMGLQKAGYWSPVKKIWNSVGSYGYAALSEVNGNGNVYEAYWDDDDALMAWDDQRFPTPVVASEDC